MKHRGAIIALCALAVASQAAAQSGGEIAMQTICASEPPRYYPERALAEEVAGHVLLDCAIDAGAFSSCRVVEEAPEGWDFGGAALRIACYMRVNADNPGANQRFYVDESGRSRVTVPINFRLE